jgi:hypothetical protein
VSALLLALVALQDDPPVPEGGWIIIEGDLFGDWSFPEEENDEEEADFTFLGVHHQTADDGGVLVKEVTEKSPAKAAGLRAGDIITAFEDVETPTNDVMVQEIVSREPGHVVTIRFLRDGDSRSTRAVLSSFKTVKSGAYVNPWVAPAIPKIDGEPESERAAHRAWVGRLAPRLGDECFAAREEATRRLVAFGPAVRRYLEPFLRDETLETQCRARHVHEAVMRPILAADRPDPATRVRLPDGAVAAAAPAGGGPTVVLSVPPCEFDCARALTHGPLADARVARLAGAFRWVVIPDYATAPELRSRFNAPRAVFVGVLDARGAPVGEVLGPEATADAIEALLRRARP